MLSEHDSIVFLLLFVMVISNVINRNNLWVYFFISFRFVSSLLVLAVCCVLCAVYCAFGYVCPYSGSSIISTVPLAFPYIQCKNSYTILLQLRKLEAVTVKICTKSCTAELNSAIFSFYFKFEHQMDFKRVS